MSPENQKSVLFGPFHGLANPWPSKPVKVPKRATGHTSGTIAVGREGEGRTGCIPVLRCNSELWKGCLSGAWHSFQLAVHVGQWDPTCKQHLPQVYPTGLTPQVRGQCTSSSCSGRNDSLTPHFLHGICKDWGQGWKEVERQGNGVVCHQCVLTAVCLPSGGRGPVVPELPLREARSKGSQPKRKRSKHPAHNALGEDIPISKPLRESPASCPAEELPGACYVQAVCTGMSPWRQLRQPKHWLSSPHSQRYGLDLRLEWLRMEGRGTWQRRASCMT